MDCVRIIKYREFVWGLELYTDFDCQDYEQRRVHTIIQLYQNDINPEDEIAGAITIPKEMIFEYMILQFIQRHFVNVVGTSEVEIFNQKHVKGKLNEKKHVCFCNEQLNRITGCIVYYVIEIFR